MENKERLIMKQVSLKAATRLVNAKSPSECDSLGYAEEVVAVATFFNEWLLEGADQVITASKPISAGNGAMFEPKCPGCSSFVWDNRETASGMQPVWRCKNEDCTSGNFSKKYNKQMAWASWDADEFSNLVREFLANNEKESTTNLIDEPQIKDEEEIVDVTVAPF